MKKYIGFNFSQLADLLLLQTKKYSKLIANGQFGTDQFVECRRIIEEIQKAMEVILNAIPPPIPFKDKKQRFKLRL